MHFFVTKRFYAPFFCRENDLRAFFVAKTIYALRPESFCSLKVAIRKIQTFWASVGIYLSVQWNCVGGTRGFYAGAISSLVNPVVIIWVNPQLYSRVAAMFRGINCYRN